DDTKKTAPLAKPRKVEPSGPADIRSHDDRRWESSASSHHRARLQATLKRRQDQPLGRDPHVPSISSSCYPGCTAAKKPHHSMTWQSTDDCGSFRASGVIG